MKTLMNRLAPLAVGLLAAVTVTAQNNNLVVFSEGGERFYLILNGLKQNETPQTNVKVTGLNAEWYTAKVIFDNTSGTRRPDLDSKVAMMDGGNFVANKEVTYAVINKKGKYKMAWRGTADIPASMQPAPNQVVYVYNPSGNATPYGTTTTTTTGGTGMNVGITGPGGETVGMSVGVTGTGMPGSSTTTTTTGGPGMTSTTTGGSTTTTTTTTTTGGPGMNMGVTGPDGQTVGVNINMTGMGGTTTTTSQTTTTTTSTGGTTVVPAPTGNGCSWPMNSMDFSKAKESVKSKSFEDSKLTVAKQILNSNCMSSSQVKEIMQLFSFEETKLDWAKFAYGKTTDPNNYYQLNDAFSFETSIDELNKYIQGH